MSESIKHDENTDKYDEFVPRESEELITLESSDDSRALAVKMIHHCRHTLNIVSRDLDPCIYNTGEMTDAIKKLVLRSRHSKIRILVMHPKSVVSHGHRFLDLSQRLSSFIKIRAINEEDKNYNRSLLIADDCSYIMRPIADRFEGTACFNDQSTVSTLNKEFKKLWKNADQEPDFRHLNI